MRTEHRGVYVPRVGLACALAVGVATCSAPEHWNGFGNPLPPPATFARAATQDPPPPVNEPGGVLSWHEAHAAITHKLVASYRGDRAKPLRIAVVDFTTSSGGLCELGSPLAEAVGNDLFVRNEFELIERRLLDKVLKEQGINRSQLSDPETAARMGRLVGVGGLVTGTVTKAGGELNVNARLVNVETAKIMAVAAVSVNRVQAELIGRCGDPPVISPPPPPGDDPQPSTGYVQGLKFEYFNLPPWSGSPPSLAAEVPALTVIASDLVQSLGRKSPAKRISATYFAIRISGEIRVETSGTHQLLARPETSLGTSSVTLGTNTVSDGTAQHYYKAGWYPFMMVISAGSQGMFGWQFQWIRPGDSDYVQVAPTLMRTKR